MSNSILNVALAFILMATMLSTTIGCEGGGDGNGNGNGNSNGEGGLRLIANIVPDCDNDGITYYDMETLRRDSELGNIYDEAEDELDSWAGYDFSGGILRMIDFDSVTYWSYLWIEDAVVIVAGDFDLDTILDKLDKDGWDDGEYKGVEIWDHESCTIAISEGRLIICDNDEDLRDCIDVIKGDKSSLYAKNINICSVIDKLPRGFCMNVTPENIIEDRTLASGESYRKWDSDNVILELAAKFKDSNTAKNELAEAEAGLSESEKDGYIESYSLKQSGDIITGHMIFEVNQIRWNGP